MNQSRTAHNGRHESYIYYVVQVSKEYSRRGEKGRVIIDPDDMYLRDGEVMKSSCNSFEWTVELSLVVLNLDHDSISRLCHTC